MEPSTWSINGLFTWTGIFSDGCDSRIRHRTKNRILPIFCAVSDAAVASDTENHVHVNRPLSYNSRAEIGRVQTVLLNQLVKLLDNALLYVVG
jgi:hypothetical protein